MAKRNLLKNTNDFIIGLALLGLGIYVILTDDIVRGVIPAHLPGGYLTRPDVYVRMIGGFLALCAAILVIKSFNFERTTETKNFHFVISWEIVLTVISLMVYTALLTRIGFFISTFLLVFFLACMYLRKEKTGAGKAPLTRKEIISDLIRILIYSILLVLGVYLIFTRVLVVVLP
ncbi:MAG: tripartite tricarboxylate transporter TctB family protein [Treponema sp.]|nr:tripartite tricarboxylate transporter TctB family protein [Treponema sp.]